MDKSLCLGVGASALMVAAIVATFPNVRTFTALILCVIGAVLFIAAIIKAIDDEK